MNTLKKVIGLPGLITLALVHPLQVTGWRYFIVYDFYCHRRHKNHWIQKQVCI